MDHFCLAVAGILAAALLSQTVAAQAPAPGATPGAGAEPKPQARAQEEKRAEAYYHYAVGHYAEQMFDSTAQEEYATQALEHYKKAYEADPASAMIGERLAEMYWKAQRITDAVKEATEVLNRNPSDLPTRRLLARIYLRSLGDLNASSGQSETLRNATEQYREIARLDPSDTDAALWLARLYRLQNSPESAQKVLRRILKTEPANEPAVEQLTQLLMDEGKTEEAIALLEGLTQHSASPALLDSLGDAYTQAKKLAKAEGAYRSAAALDPAEASHQRGLAQTLLSEEKYTEALGVYRHLSEIEPEDADVLLRISQIYRELHKLDDAEKVLLRARQLAPGSIEVMYNEALLYQAQGRFEDAIRVLSDTVAGIRGHGGATSPASRRTLGILYQQLGQLYREVQKYQPAIYTFQEMQRLGDEEDRRARLLMMETWRAARDLPKALDEAKRANEKYPNDPAIRASYASLCGENGQVEQAIQILRGQVQKGEVDRDTYLSMAQIYERARRYREAEENARRAEALPGDPRENEMVWFLLGAVYERQKLFGRAEAEFQKVLGVNPRNAPVLNYYGYMLGDLGIRLDEAQTLVERALVEDPQSGAYLDSLGWIYFKQNKLAEAEATLRRAVERESHDPTIHSHLAELYFRTGRKDPAAAEWEKSLTEWHRALPADREPDKVAEVEKKLNQVKHHVAARKPSSEEAKPQ
jgi:tetratricopeptide (TPR) repeat protein